MKKEYEESKAKLEQLYDYFTQGAIIRSKCSWYEKGEKSTKYFLNLEKHGKSMTQVRKLRKDENEITDLSIINNELKQFYINLYSKKSLMTEEQCMDIISEVSTPSLAREEAEICEGKLTLQECFTALKQMPGNKSPGNDGLTKGFLLCFFRNIGSLLVESINHSFEVGELSSSQKQAMIVLIGKKKSDKRFIKN